MASIARQVYDQAEPGVPKHLPIEPSTVYHALTMSNDNVVEFIPRASIQNTLDEQLRALANRAESRVSLRRKEVVEAFTTAFEMIGGVPRLATWAQDHETEFYKLYARLMPSAAADAGEQAKTVHVIHVLPPKAIDGHIVPALKQDE